MKAGEIFKSGSLRKILCKLKDNGKLIAFLLVFSLGFIFGVVSFHKIEFLKNFYDFLTQSFCGLRADGTFITVLINSFFNALLVLVFIFASGSSVLGFLLIPCGVFTTGFAYGVMASGLYSAHSFNGVAFFAILIVPSAVLLIIALILAAIEAVNFSFLLIKTVGFGEKNETISQSFKDFCLKNLLLCLFVLAAAIIDSLISINFFKNFNLF